MKSSLFLRNITNIDHAYINEHGQVIGGSFHASMIVSGKVDEKEKVVIDFSACKKDLKAILDDFADGYDHKLWIIDGVSNVVGDSGTMVVTPACTLTAPTDMYKRFYADSYSPKTIAAAMSVELTKKMKKLYAEADVEVEVSLDTNAFTHDQNALFFSYSHGLKNSSSGGCRRNSHGHLSFIEFKNINTVLSVKLLDEIKQRIDNAVFVWRDNVVESTDTHTKIYYTAVDGREYSATYDNELNNVIVLETETTVEYLAEFIATEYGARLREFGCTDVYMSEGLQKGAAVKL